MCKGDVVRDNCVKREDVREDCVKGEVIGGKCVKSGDGRETCVKSEDVREYEGDECGTGEGNISKGVKEEVVRKKRVKKDGCFNRACQR